MKKRLLSLFVASTFILAMATGCSSDSSSSSDSEAQTVTLWVEGSDNLRIAYEAAFEVYNETEAGKLYPAELQFILSGSGTQSLRDRMIAEYQEGKMDTGFDLMDLNIDNYAEYINLSDENFFQEIDTSKLSNFDSVQASVEEGINAVPYRATTVVLAYNSETVPNPPTTEEELTQWIKDNPGRFAYNVPSTGGAGESYLKTSVYNRIDDESALISSDVAWMDEWDAGFAYLEEIHPYMYQSGGSIVYPNKNQGTLDLLANKEVDIIPAWADMVISQLSAGTLPSSIKITQLDPSLTGTLVGLMIPEMSTNVEGAYALIDFMLSPEAQDIFLSEMAAIPVIDQSLLTSDNAEIVADLKIDEFRVQSLGDLSSIIMQQWDETIAVLPNP